MSLILLLLIDKQRNKGFENVKSKDMSNVGLPVIVFLFETRLNSFSFRAVPVTHGLLS